MKDLTIAAFFAISMLYVCILSKINKLLVEAAGVGLWVRIENKQVIDSKGPLETQKAAKTQISSTLQVHGIQQSSVVISCSSNDVSAKSPLIQHQNQKEYLSANWTVLGDVSEIIALPNAGDSKIRFGIPKLG